MSSFCLPKTARVYQCCRLSFQDGAHCVLTTWSPRRICTKQIENVVFVFQFPTPLTTWCSSGCPKRAFLLWLTKVKKTFSASYSSLFRAAARREHSSCTVVDEGKNFLCVLLFSLSSGCPKRAFLLWLTKVKRTILCVILFSLKWLTEESIPLVVDEGKKVFSASYSSPFLTVYCSVY